MKTIKLYVIIYIILLSGCSIQKADFYIAPNGNDQNPGTYKQPFATITRGRDAVREILHRGIKKNITVLIRGGNYYIEQTIKFELIDATPEDHTVTYSAYKNEKPVISSGINIIGWEKTGKGKIWVAPLPQTSNTNWNFKTLYDGNTMLPRARGKGFVPDQKCPEPVLAHRWDDLTTLKFPKGTLKNPDNLQQDVEIFIRPNHQWLVNYLPLKSVNEETRIAITSVPGTYRLTRVVHKDWKETCWVENVLKALDEPGEWVLNTKTKKIYLWPKKSRPGNNIFGPALRELVLVQGETGHAPDADTPVNGLIFKGLTLTHGDRDVWTGDDRGIQHDWEMWDKNNALLRFRSAKNCIVDNCTFFNSGGTGIRLDRYAQNIKLLNNHIHHLGATAILFCGHGPGKKDVNKNNLAQYNLIHDCGTLYWHSPAFFIWQSGNNRILNNHIYNMPYDAIVLSGVRPRYFGISDPVKWKGYNIPKDLRENMRTIRWDEVGQPKTSAEALKFAHAKNNLIQDNEIHNVMQMLGDGNAIYFSCAGINNIVKRNLIYNCTNAASEIRFDDDQEESYVTENIIFGNGIKLKHKNYIHNNIVIGGGISLRPEITTGAEVKHNIIYSLEDKPEFYKSNSDVFPLNKLIELANPDYNLFYSLNEIDGRNLLTAIQEFGFDKNSVFARPRFNNFKKGDLSLKPDSPAFKLGIKSIDIKKIGLPHDPAYKHLKNVKLRNY